MPTLQSIVRDIEAGTLQVAPERVRAELEVELQAGLGAASSQWVARGMWWFLGEAEQTILEEEEFALSL